MQVLLRSEHDGSFLSCDSQQPLGLVDRCGDGGIWLQQTTSTFVNAGTGTTLSVSVIAEDVAADADAAVRFVHRVGAGLLTFSTEPAPSELPSVYLERLRKEGHVLVPGLLSQSEAVLVRKQVLAEMAASER